MTRGSLFLRYPQAAAQSSVTLRNGVEMPSNQSVCECSSPPRALRFKTFPKQVGLGGHVAARTPARLLWRMRFSVESAAKLVACRYNATEASASVEAAVGAGFRHIDTALDYGNQAGVSTGLRVRASGVTLCWRRRVMHRRETNRGVVCWAVLPRCALVGASLFLLSPESED